MAPEASARAPGLWLPAFSLAERELVRFLRQPDRVMGALGQPLLFWLIFGTGFSPSFRAPGMEDVGYLEYFFPGMLAMVLLFSAIYSTVSVIEDRKEGFLQGVLVSPASPFSIVAGKVLGGTALATFQAALCLVVLPFLGVNPGLVAGVLLVLFLALVAVGLVGLGLLLAWRMDSTAGFHAIMMVLLMPMWFLSGAVFPAAGLPRWMELIVAVNPLTYGVAGIRHLLYRGELGGSHPAMVVCLAVPVGFAALMLVVDSAVVRRRARVRIRGSRASRSKK